MMVCKYGLFIKYYVYIEVVGYECDLVFVWVYDDEFWEGMLELELGDILFF